MSEVVAVIQPFVLKQQVYVFDGVEITKQFSTELVNLSEDLLSLCYGNNIFNVNLRGDSHFVAKIRQDLEIKEMAHYGAHKLQINAV